MKYLKASIPCNYFYFVVDDDLDVTNLTLDLVSNKLMDISGNVIRPYNTVYCMGCNNKDAKACIKVVKTLPFPEDKTN